MLGPSDISDTLHGLLLKSIKSTTSATHGLPVPLSLSRSLSHAFEKEGFDNVGKKQKKKKKKCWLPVFSPFFTISSTSSKQNSSI